ncbi:MULTISPECIES: DNA-directed RNA polymerase subunit beta [Lacticaseibacillus]|uniref:DNA-directed RNA polymerase subunit beta n=1 Tax=Lacticaseibacillus hegangensis TaxID=2486010 RepID=A0ABW4CZG9_9LACO|nr:MULTISPECIES: DNA-directed RNA polymerase subunit beta [Lacticaseibacillus]
MSSEYAMRVVRKLLIGLLLVIAALILGAMVGYAIDGGNPFKVFVPSTWTHILDFLK